MSQGQDVSERPGCDRVSGVEGARDIGREYDFVSKEQDLRLIDALEEIYAETGKILRITFFFLFRVRYVTIKTVCVRPGIQGAYSKNRQGKADGQRQRPSALP